MYIYIQSGVKWACWDRSDVYAYLCSLTCIWIHVCKCTNSCVEWAAGTGLIGIYIHIRAYIQVYVYVSV